MNKYYEVLEDRGTRDYAVFCAPLQRWLAPVEPPTASGWPVPRDTKTDPPTEKDADQSGCILEWFSGQASFWRRVDWDKANPFGVWLPLPPAPTPPKSAAEVAYDKELTTFYVGPDRRDSEKRLFVAGYEAGQKEAAK